MSAKLNFLFPTWEGGGNVTPVVEVMRKLRRAGHRVRLMSDECNRAEAEGVGAAFASWTRAPNRADRRAESQACRDWAAPDPFAALVVAVRDTWCVPSLAYAQDLLDELRREPADLVVSSDALFGVMAACESVGQRFVVLSPNVSFSPAPGIPPLGPGLAPARNDAERAAHAELAKAAEAVFDSGLPALNATRAALGLAPLAHVLDQPKAAVAELLATSRAFDFPADSLPDRMRYVGPQIADPGWAKPWKSPWDASEARPLVTVGFSTTFQNHADVLQRVIDGLAPLPVRVLVTLGGSIERSALRAPANCVIVESAPHTVVLKEAALLVTHGGHGTVMRGLVNRVPMLVVPHGRDQNDNAVRVTERGAGLSLAATASAEEIRAAAARLLGEPSFRAAARRLGDAVAAEAEGSRVVCELESLAAPAMAAVGSLP